MKCFFQRHSLPPSSLRILGPVPAKRLCLLQPSIPLIVALTSSIHLKPEVFWGHDFTFANRVCIDTSSIQMLDGLLWSCISRFRFRDFNTSTGLTLARLLTSSNYRLTKNQRTNNAKNIHCILIFFFGTIPERPVFKWTCY